MNKVYSFSFTVLAFGLYATGLHAQTVNAIVPSTNGAAVLTIPHKAPASAANGVVDLMLRVYAEKTSNAPLFEERQTIPVQNGSYLAFIGSATPGGIPATIYNSKGTFWIEAVPVGAALNTAVERVPFSWRRDASTPRGTDSITLSFAVDSSVCFTCGGAWPIFSGMIPSSGGHATERAGSCSGPLTYRTDSTPYICSR